MNTIEESPQEESIVELLDSPRNYFTTISIVYENKYGDVQEEWRRKFESDDVHDIFFKMFHWNECWYEDAKKTFSE